MKRSLLDGPSASSKTVAPELRDALSRLDALGQQRPFLAQPIALLRNVLLEIGQTPPLNAVTLAGDAALKKLRSGTPLLRGEPFAIDENLFRRRWNVVCRAVQRHQPSHSAAPLETILDQQGWSVEGLVGDVLAGRIDKIRSRARSDGLDAELTALVLRLTLFPTMSHAASSMARWRSEVRWNHGVCPTCGGWPLLAEFRGLEQLRFLRCGLCATEWEFPRLKCPFCSTQDHELLGFFHAEGEEAKYRVATCDGCLGYVKTASTLSALADVQLLVEDLATVHLDFAAVDRGYSPPVNREEL